MTRTAINADSVGMTTEGRNAPKASSAPSPGEGDAPVAWRIDDLILPQTRFTADAEYARRTADYRYEGEPTARVTPLYTRPTPATPEGLREAVRKVRLWVKCGMPDQSDDTPRRDALRRDLAILALWAIWTTCLGLMWAVGLARFENWRAFWRDAGFGDD